MLLFILSLFLFSPFWPEVVKTIGAASLAGLFFFKRNQRFKQRAV
jgi:hypothetical protein